jgi:hypothetical protein
MSYRSIIYATNIFTNCDDCLPVTARLYCCCCQYFPLILKIVDFRNLLRPAFPFDHYSENPVARFSHITTAIL